LQCFCFNLRSYRLICHDRLRKIWASYSTWFSLIISRIKSCLSSKVSSLRLFISLLIFILSVYRKFPINQSSESFFTLSKSKYPNCLTLCSSFLLISHDDHNEPANKGSTITGSFRGNLFCFFENRRILSAV